MGVNPNMPADDLQTAIEEAQAALEESGNTMLPRDPIRLTLAALSAVMSVFLRSTKRWERAVADVIAARDPLPEEDRIALQSALIEAVENGAYRGVRTEAGRMVRLIDRGLAIRAGLAAGSAFAVGAFSMLAILTFWNLGPFNPDVERQAAWATVIKSNPDPRPALDAAEIRSDQNGRRYYAHVSLWLDPASPPPNSH